MKKVEDYVKGVRGYTKESLREELTGELVDADGEGADAYLLEQ